MRLRRIRPARPGTTLVESAVVLGVFLTLLFGLLDLGIGVFRYHLVAGAARAGVRQAIVNGALAAAPWGPQNTGPLCGLDSNPGVQALQPYLVGMDLSAVTVTLEWLDGGNDRGQRVRVTVTAPYQPTLIAIFGTQPIVLSASSTMPIAH